MASLDVCVIDNLESFYGLSGEWNAVLDESDCDSFFLTWEWMTSWAECCLAKNRRLFILAFYEKEALVGIAPFYITLNRVGPVRLREVRYLGVPEGGADYLSVFSRRGYEKNVANALYDFLVAGAGAEAWDQLSLGDMPACSLFFVHFMTRIQAEGKYVEMNQSSFCPILKLPKTVDELYASLSPRWRKKFKQDVRVVNRDSQIRYSVVCGNEVSDWLDEFFKLYEEKGGWSAGLLPDVIGKVIEKYDGESPFQLNTMSCNDKMIGSLLHIKYKDNILMYMMAIDKEFNDKISLGNLLVGISIKEAIISRFVTYDFLKGNESYKFHWANTANSTFVVNIWRKNLVARYSAYCKFSRNAGKLLFR